MAGARGRGRGRKSAKKRPFNTNQEDESSKNVCSPKKQHIQVTQKKSMTSKDTGRSKSGSKPMQEFDCSTPISVSSSDPVQDSNDSAAQNSRSPSPVYDRTVHRTPINKGRPKFCDYDEVINVSHVSAHHHVNAGRKPVNPMNKGRSQSRDDDEVSHVSHYSQDDNFNAPRTPETPSGRRYWRVPGKEEEICRLWEEEANLYDMSHPDHLNPHARQASQKRISAVLEIPVNIIKTQMETLRTAYQKKISEAEASGSSPKAKTAHTREILRMCAFLHAHIKTCLSVSNYSGVRPTHEPSKYTRTPESTSRSLFIKTKAYAEEEKRMMKDVEHGESSGYQRHPSHLGKNEKFANIDSEDNDSEIDMLDDPISHRTQLGSSPKHDPLPDIDYKTKRQHGKNDETKYKKESASKSSCCKTVGLSKSGPVKKNDEQNSLPKSTSGGTSKATVKTNEKTKAYDLNIDIDNNDDDINNDDWYNQHSERKKSKKPAENSIVQVLQDRSKMMEKMSDTVCAISQATIKQNEDDSADSHWAKSLLIQMKRMDQRIKDRFMIHVSQIALDAIDGKLP